MPNLKLVPLVILELLAFNAQKTMGSRPLFEKNFSGVMSGLSLGACVPNLKFVPLTILELLAFNGQKVTGSRDPGHALLFEKIFQGSCGNFPWEQACQI